MNCTTISALSLAALLTLTACSPAPEKPAAEVAVATTATAAPAPTAAEPPPPAPPVQNLTQPLTGPALPPSFLPTFTVSDLMKDTINPNAKALWEAVSYTVNEKGTTDTKPTTAADWAALRMNADALKKAAATLLLPALKIANDQQDAPTYQYTPAEIDLLRQMNPDPWRRYADRLLSTTLQVIADIEKQDVDAYVEDGAPINQTCEGCHSQFWYRRQQRRFQ
jgi:hypothetical protein